MSQNWEVLSKDIPDPDIIHAIQKDIKEGYQVAIIITVNVEDGWLTSSRFHRIGNASRIALIRMLRDHLEALITEQV